MLNNIADNIEQRGQQNIVQCSIYPKKLLTFCCAWKKKIHSGLVLDLVVRTKYIFADKFFFIRSCFLLEPSWKPPRTRCRS